MDARKVEFLMSLQNEIDRLEQSGGSGSSRLENIKSRFRNLVKIEELVVPSPVLLTRQVKPGFKLNINYEDDELPHNSIEPCDEEALNEPGLELKSNINTKTINPSPHRPKDVADFMNLFNSPTGLKYLTHDWNEEIPFDIDLFLEGQKQIFQEKAKEYKIPSTLWTIINHFAFSENPSWGLQKKDGWSKAERVEWSRRNKKSILYNPEFVKTKDHFVNLIRVEPPHLNDILETVLKEKLADRYHLFQESLRLTSCEKAYFYTNILIFKVALRHIFDGIYKRSEVSTKLSIIYSREMDGDYQRRIIRICHFNSFPLRPLDEVVEEIPSGKGDFYEIYKRLRGYCHWDIETCWDGRNVRLSILNEDDKIQVIPIDDTWIMDGFTHVLTFYYR